MSDDVRARETMADEAPAGLPVGLSADVRALIEMMARGGIADLQLETVAVKLRLRAHGAAPTTNAPPPGRTVADTLIPIEAPAGHVITAPMIGTFYHAPGPGEPPFVNVGDTVEAGQTVGIIEAMKIMNEIASEHAGVVAEVLAGSGQAVEYGQPLMRLHPLPDAGLGA